MVCSHLPSDFDPLGSLRAFLFVIFSLFLAGCAVRSPKHASTPAGAVLRPELRVATYNLFVGAGDFAKTAKAIRGLNADIIALQEVLPQTAASLDRELTGDYPYRFFADGLGFLSRFPIRKPRSVRSNHGMNGFLFAEVDYEGRRFQVANLHLDPLRSWTLAGKVTLPLQIVRQGRVHRAELAQVFENLRPDLPTIILGDFNRASDASLSELRHTDFVDSFRSVTPRADRTPTLRFSILGFRSGRRIDFIFHDRNFRTIQSSVVSGTPSDHDAVVSALGVSR